MRSWLVGGAAVFALLLCVPSALAALGTFQGHGDTPLRTVGVHASTADDARFVLTGDEGQVSLLLHGAQGQLSRIIHRAYGIVDVDNPKAQVLWTQEVEVLDLDLEGGVLSLESREADFQVLAYHARANLESGARQGPLRLDLGEEVRIRDQFPAPLSVQVHSDAKPFEHVVPAGLLRGQALDGRLTLHGGFEAFVSGATLTWFPPGAEPVRIQAYSHRETRPGSLYDPLGKTWFGAGTHEETVHEYLLLRAQGGHFDLQFAGVAGALHAARQEVSVTGEAILPGVVGTVTVEGPEGMQTHRLDGEDLALSGRFALLVESPGPDGRSRVTGHGDFTAVSYGEVRAEYGWATAVAMGLGALALAGLAWVAAHGKALLGSLGGALVGYARVHGDEVLEHPGRAEVYERVKAFPGVNFVQLSEGVSFGASTLNYHLRVLERNGYITSVRDGRYLRFFDRTTGSYAGNRKMAVSALRNETSAAIAKHIRDHPGVAQYDLATAFGVTPSTVTWHINRLAQQGLVQKSREAQHTRYYIGEGWAQLPADEQARQAPVITA